MKCEISSRDEFYDDADLRTTSPRAAIPKQINCHLCYDTYYRRHFHHRDKRSSKNEMTDLQASAFLLCSSNIGYIVHTPPPQPTPPPPPPPPPPSSITCCCSSCCSTSRKHSSPRSRISLSTLSSCSIPLSETKDMRFQCNLSHLPTSYCSRNNSIKKNNYKSITPSSCCYNNKALPIHNVCHLQPKNYYLSEDKVELYDDQVNEEVPNHTIDGTSEVSEFIYK